MMIKEKFISLCNKMFALSKLLRIHMFVSAFMWVFSTTIMEVSALTFIIVSFNTLLIGSQTTCTLTNAIYRAILILCTGHCSKIKTSHNLETLH